MNHVCTKCEPGKTYQYNSDAAGADFPCEVEVAQISCNVLKTMNIPMFRYLSATSCGVSAFYNPMEKRNYCYGGTPEGANAQGLGHVLAYSYANAHTICKANGMQICSRAEFLSNVPAGSGCFHNGRFCWTREACTTPSGEDGHYVEQGTKTCCKSDYFQQHKCQGDLWQTDLMYDIGVRCCQNF